MEEFNYDDLVVFGGMKVNEFTTPQTGKIPASMYVPTNEPVWVQYGELDAADLTEPSVEVWTVEFKHGTIALLTRHTL